MPTLAAEIDLYPSDLLDREDWGENAEGRHWWALYTRSRREKELMRRLREFTEKDAASDSAFRLRIGMFFAVDAEARARILEARDSYLEQREKKYTHLASAMDLGKWGGETAAFLLDQVRAERRWVLKLKKMSASSTG